MEHGRSRVPFGRRRSRACGPYETEVVEVNRRQANVDEIDWEQPDIGAAQADLVNRDPTALQAIIFVEDQLKDIATRSGTRIGDQAARDFLPAHTQAEHNLHNRPIMTERPLDERHYFTLQISCTAS
jgi:hypothetical protein